MNMNSRIFTIVPVYNRIHHAEACLEQLQAQVCDLSQTVIVVDDGSSDGTAEMIRSKFPNTVLIEGKGTWYWTGSVYRGVERALEMSQSDDDYVFMLNDDLDFEPDLLQKLVDFSQARPRSIVQALGCWVDRRDVIQYAGVKVNWWLAKRTRLYEEECRSSFPENHVVESDVLTGRGVLFPIKVFQEVGNYDLRIVHRGDPELTRRAAKAGWELLVYFGAVVYSYPVKGKGNINERDVYRLRNLKEYYFGALSSAHIPTLWRNARTYTNSLFQAFVFFTCHLAGMTYNFVRKLKRV